VNRIVEGKEISAPLDLETDVVFIGSGAGGAACAKELREAGLRVVLVEEGGWYPPEFYRNLAPRQAFKYLYRDYGMTTALGKNPFRDPAVPFPLGKCIGGTTVINSGTCFRTPEEIVELWNREFGLGIRYGDLERIFARVEEIIGATPVPDEVAGKNAQVFAEGARSLGFKAMPLTRNATGCQGSGRCVFGCPTNAKKGTHLSYIPLGLKLGVEVYADLRIERFRYQGNRVTAVEGWVMDRENNKPRVPARISARVVVVAGGAVGTPVLLERNGIRSDHLGKHLRIHPGIRVAALFDEVIEGWKGVPQGYYLDHFVKTHGIMFEGIFVPPNLALPVLPYAGEKFVEIARLYPHLAAFGAMVKDTSEGEVFARRGMGTVIRYAFNEKDKENLIFAVQKAAEIYFARGARRVFPAIYGFTELRSPEEVRKMDPARIKPQHLEMMGFHPMGTARMCRDPRGGVVDPNGKVFGVENLYVADASLFPTCLGVNPMESIMAFATYVAEKIANIFS
jgi:choline dehydrogenase-like flavoprotein